MVGADGGRANSLLGFWRGPRSATNELAANGLAIDEPCVSVVFCIGRAVDIAAAQTWTSHYHVFCLSYEL